MAFLFLRSFLHSVLFHFVVVVVLVTITRDCRGVGRAARLPLDDHPHLRFGLSFQPRVLPWCCSLRRILYILYFFFLSIHLLRLITLEPDDRIASAQGCQRTGRAKHRLIRIARNQLSYLISARVSSGRTYNSRNKSIEELRLSASTSPTRCTPHYQRGSRSQQQSYLQQRPSTRTTTPQAKPLPHLARIEPPHSPPTMRTRVP